MPTDRTPDPADVEAAALSIARCSCGCLVVSHSTNADVHTWRTPGCTCQRNQIEALVASDWLAAYADRMRAEGEAVAWGHSDRFEELARSAERRAVAAEERLAAGEALADEWDAEAATDEAWLNGPRVSVSEAHELPAAIRQARSHATDLRSALDRARGG